MVNIMSYTVILDQTITWTPARPNRLLENATLLIGRPGDFFLRDPDPLLELGGVLSNFGDENWYRFGKEATWLVTSWTTWDDRKSKLQTIHFQALFVRFLNVCCFGWRCLKQICRYAWKLSYERHVCLFDGLGAETTSKVCHHISSLRSVRIPPSTNQDAKKSKRELLAVCC